MQGISVALPAAAPELPVLFIALALSLAVLFVGAVSWSGARGGVGSAVRRRRTLVATAGTVVWLSATWALAARGVLHFAPTPTMVPVFLVTFGLAFAITFSPIGTQLVTHLPIAALVGYQGFRVVVELLMHTAYTIGLMPVQMSYSGRNFDIVSGITALLLGGWLATRGTRWSRGIVFAWNTLGLALLVNILAVALLSAPTPFRYFMNEPANTWITQAPWVWLPTVMVLAALTGHLLVYRRLRIESRIIGTL